MVIIKEINKKDDQEKKNMDDQNKHDNQICLSQDLKHQMANVNNQVPPNQNANFQILQNWHQMPANHMPANLQFNPRATRDQLLEQNHMLRQALRDVNTMAYDGLNLYTNFQNHNLLYAQLSHMWHETRHY